MNQGNWRRGIYALGVLLCCGSANAAPGDVYRVTADRVNLRTGPSDDATVRTTVKPGQRLIELRRTDSWVGVRVANTGDEGWIYQELLKRTARSELGTVGAGGPFEAFSRDFADLVKSIEEAVGYPLAVKVQRSDPRTLRITPSKEWLVAGGRDSHVMAVVSIYEMWKIHQDGAPVTVVLLAEDTKPYITVKDTDAGPELILARLGQGGP